MRALRTLAPPLLLLSPLLLPLLLLLAALPFPAHAADLTVTIPSTALLRDPSALPASTHATLQGARGTGGGGGGGGGELVAPLTRAGAFVFRGLAPGSYLLAVHCRDFAFEPVRVDVTAAEEGEKGEGEGEGEGRDGDGDGGRGRERVEAWQTFRGREWDSRGEKRGEGRGQALVEARAVRAMEYYQARGGFSLLSLLKSPMILMGLFSLLMIVGMPYLMENMDAEDRAAFEELQKKSPLAAAANPASQLQNFDLASWMAGKSGQEAASSSTPRRRG